MKKIGSMPFLLFLGLAVASTAMGSMDAQKIAEMHGPEPLWVFLIRLPGSFEAQVVYGLVGSGLIGLLSRFAWKWSQGQADGFAHFTGKYVVGQILWLVGSSVAAVMTVGFSTETGEFFGWLSVFWAGGFAGWSGEFKTSRKEWTPEQRANGTGT